MKTFPQYLRAQQTLHTDKTIRVRGLKATKAKAKTLNLKLIQINTHLITHARTHALTHAHAYRHTLHIIRIGVLPEHLVHMYMS